MKTITKLILLLGMIFSPTINAQDNQKVLAKLIITDANIDGFDATPEIQANDTYTIFYTIENDDLLYMANVMSKKNSQSYGHVYNWREKYNAETIDQYKSNIFTFNWRYTNTYDGKSGTCRGELVIIHKPQGVVTSLTLITEDLRVIVYKGYMDGTLNF